METEKYRGFNINIHQDELAENPREMFDHLGTMVCWHSKYTLGDKHDYTDNKEFESWVKEQGNKIIVLPLYLYDHGGITMLVAPSSCQWDSGQVGYIYMEIETYREACPKIKSEKELIEKAKECLLAEVEEYDHYLTGNVYYYSIEPSDRNKKIECDGSCGGFGGYDFEENGLLEYARNSIDCMIKQYRKTVKKEKLVRVNHRNLMVVCY